MVRAFAHGAMGRRIDPLIWGAGRSSEVERLLTVRWVVGSILHWVEPLSYFSYQPVLHDLLLLLLHVLLFYYYYYMYYYSFFKLLVLSLIFFNLHTF